MGDRERIGEEKEEAKTIGQNQLLGLLNILERLDSHLLLNT